MSMSILNKLDEGSVKVVSPSVLANNILHGINISIAQA